MSAEEEQEKQPAVDARCKLCGQPFDNVTAYDAHVMDHMKAAMQMQSATQQHPVVAAAMAEPSPSAFNVNDPAHVQILLSGLLQMAPEILDIVFGILNIFQKRTP